MKNKIFNDTRLLDAMDYIDSSLIAETADKIRPPAAPKREAEQPKTKRIVFAWKQAAALVACALVMGAIIPAVSMLIGNIRPAGPTFSDGSAGSNAPAHESESETSTEETDVPNTVYDGSPGLEYVINADGKSATFIGFGTCTDEDIVIASTYNGFPVTEMINDKRNEGAPAEEAGSLYAKSITVSDTVESISGGIFESCPNLESIYIGANVNFIRSFMTPKHNLSKLVEIVVSEDNKHFSDKGNCLIEKQSKTIIASCKNSVIPDDGSVEIIGVFAFFGYPKKELTIPDSIKRIENSAFAESKLSYVQLPKDLEYLGSSVFSGCQELESADLNGFTRLPNVTFGACHKLSNIEGIENVTFIGNQALIACTSLEELSLGAGLTEIGEEAFALTYLMDTINYAGTVEQWHAIQKGENWNDKLYFIEYVNCSDGKATP
ncbi:MAG: leucine-rich repeat domain-containing protein [Clostridia bacterium]|nr:leucine-rich repeat domain-containing protein [Clostridia bacterium]